MAEKRRLTPPEWAQARRRWEGSPLEGFDWLAAEIRAAWNVEITRQGVSVRAAREGWAKGGEESQPLKGASPPAATTQQRPAVAQQPARKPRFVAQQKPPEEVTDIGEDGRPVPPDEGAEGEQQAPPGEARPWLPAPAKLGRPTKYRPEFATELIKYFSGEPFENIVIDVDSGRTAQVPAKFPMFQTFAAKIGVGVSTLREWATEQAEDGALKRPDFAAAYARAHELQQANLVQGTMAGAYEPRFATLAAKNLIGWRDKVEVATDQIPTSKEVLEATYVTEMALAHERQARVRAERAALRGEVE